MPISTNQKISFYTELSGTSVNFDTQGFFFPVARLNLTANTVMTITNKVIGQQGKLIISQDVTGGRSLTLPLPSIGNSQIKPDPSQTTILDYFWDGNRYLWSNDYPNPVAKPALPGYIYAGITSYEINNAGKLADYRPWICDNGWIKAGFSHLTIPDTLTPYANNSGYWQLENFFNSAYCSIRKTSLICDLLGTQDATNYWQMVIYGISDSILSALVTVNTSSLTAGNFKKVTLLSTIINGVDQPVTGYRNLDGLCCNFQKVGSPGTIKPRSVAIEYHLGT